MEERPDREHLLQKIVAVSGFLFALLILPVAQFVLVNGRANQAEKGNVAGVSTDETITRGSVATDPATCTTDKQKQLTDLQSWLTNRMVALDRDYKASVQPYQAALPLVTGNDIQAEKAALNQLIADETTKYNTDKAQITAAVDKQTKEFSAIDCGETPTAGQ
jgi:hypothetical protein